MRLPFLNRTREITKLNRALGSSEAAFIVIYGRRRTGKSRLLQHISKKNDIYFLADMQEVPLQIKSLASEIGRHISGFDQVIYPSWDILFEAIQNQACLGTTLILDEFPYLVQKSPELPSIIQKQVDSRQNKINLILCGSSQRMMQGLVLDGTSPLYGRAVEIIKLRPLEAGWIPIALNLDSVGAIEAYAIWGGVPRYWELAKQFSNLAMACKEQILDRDGVLHDEPMRLLLDDMRGASQPHSLLSLIAGGANRISEIAVRLGKPATSLTRPLANLIQLGYIKRDIPFGENPKLSKKTLYRLEDPFLQFWYRIVLPNYSLLEQGLVDEVFDSSKQLITSQTAEVWEELARKSTAHLQIGGCRWKPASRWWGKGLNGKIMEFGIVAESLDGQSILFGEAKWENETNVQHTLKKLQKQVDNFPQIGQRRIILALWCKQSKSHSTKALIFNAEDVLSALKK